MGFRSNRDILQSMTYKVNHTDVTQNKYLQLKKGNTKFFLHYLYNNRCCNKKRYLSFWTKYVGEFP